MTECTKDSSVTSSRIKFEIQIGGQRHSSVMINVKKRNLPVFLPQNEKDCVHEIDYFQEVKVITSLHKEIPDCREIILWFWYAEKLPVLQSVTVDRSLLVCLLVKSFFEISLSQSHR